MPGLAAALLIAAGLFNLAFALFHLFFWPLFNWAQELPRLSVANRGIVPVLNICLTYVFALTAALLLLLPLQVAGTELGRLLLVAGSGFWLLRAILQPIFFPLRHPLSATLFGVFILGTILHALAWWALRDT
jgi:hypothetical protein